MSATRSIPPPARPTIRKMAESLERRFDEAMHELYGRIVRECDGRYHPIVFHDMLERYGGLDAAHRLLRIEKYPGVNNCLLRNRDVINEQAQARTASTARHPATGFLGEAGASSWLPKPRATPCTARTFKGNGETTTMTRQESAFEASIQKAFGLLLEIRGHRDAGHLLHLAVAFLNMLLQDADPTASPVVVSIHAVRIREP